MRYALTKLLVSELQPCNVSTPIHSPVHFPITSLKFPTHLPLFTLLASVRITFIPFYSLSLNLPLFPLFPLDTDFQYCY